MCVKNCVSLWACMGAHTETTFIIIDGAMVIIAMNFNSEVKIRPLLP